jgi:gas vesicle protein
MAGINGNYFAGVSSTLAAGTAGEHTTNWEQVSTRVESGLSPIRSALGIVIANTEHLKADTKEIKADTKEIKADTKDLKDDTKEIKADTKNLKDDTKEIKQGIERNQEQIISEFRTLRDGIAHEIPTRLPKGNLHQSAPQPNLLLTSRAEFRERLNEWAATPGVGKALALVGEPGVNTTDLARDLAAAFDPADPDRSGPYREVWWLGVHAPDDPKSDSPLAGNLSRLLGELGHPPEKETDGLVLASSVRAALADGPRTLFIIDGLADPGLLSALLPGGACTTLVTTQRSDLPPQVITSWHVPRLTDAEAFEVLTAQREDLRTATEDPALRQIITEVGGNDIALELGAAFLARASRPTTREYAAALCGNAGPENHPFNISTLPRGASSDTRAVACVLGAAWIDLPPWQEMALLRAAAWCAPDNIPLTVLYSAAGLRSDVGIAAAEELARRSIVRINRTGDFLTLSLPRPVQRVLQLTQESGGVGKREQSLGPLLDALRGFFVDSTRHEKYAIRTAAIAHAETAIGYASTATGDGDPASARLAISEAASLLEDKAALLRFALADHLHVLGQVASSAVHIDAAIAWVEARSPRNEQELAVFYSLRAEIREAQGDAKGAEEDIARSIDWGERQVPRDERALAIRYSMRASNRWIRGDLYGAQEDIARSIDWDEKQRPRDERMLAIHYSIRATIRQSAGNLKGAEEDIARSIAWGESERPRDERALAIRYTIRAYLRQLLGDISDAQADIAHAIEWEESQTPRDERALNIRYATRAGIRRDEAKAARESGDEAAASASLVAAQRDIDSALKWWRENLPEDERTLGIFLGIKASLDGLNRSN